MATRNVRCGAGNAAILALGALLGVASGAYAQGPVRTNLKKVLVLDKSQVGASGHLESRRDLNAALNQLAAEKGFTITFIGQNDPASKIATEFSAANLATYQAVIFSNNDGVHAMLNATEKANFEAYVKNGGGFIPVHAASAFISNWPWMTSVLVESFYGPTGSNQPTFNLSHDPEGTREGTETQGIFKGLTAPRAFLDECYSFRASPRGRPGVTILLTVDEKSFSKPIDGPMGDDHPVAWSKTEGKGRVAHISQGHSWSTNNVYAAKDSYLKYFLYGALRYVAGDFLGCTDNRYLEYNPDATKSDSAACREPALSIHSIPGGGKAGTLFSRQEGEPFVKVTVQAAGRHEVRMLDVAGRPIQSRHGVGPAEYALPMPAKSGIYVVVSRAGGQASRYRVTVL